MFLKINDCSGILFTNVYLGLNFENPRENDESEKRGYFECEIGKDLVKPARDCKVYCEIGVIQS